MKYEAGSANRLGNRTKNQDRYALAENGDTLLLVVADGMGGHKGGELAAQEAIDSIRALFEQQETPLEDPAQFLFHAIGKAHDNIAVIGMDDEPPFFPRTTCVLCIIQDGKAQWAHVGDSRLYLLRDNAIEVRTRDHSYVEDLVRNDVISEEEMLTHPMKHYVSYCLGGQNEGPPIEISEPVEIHENDIILLCTDGLWGSTNVEDILHLKGISLDHAVNRLAEHAEKSSYPHSDNVTALAIRLLSTAKEEKAVHPDTLEEPAQEPKDPVSRAISWVKKALRDYGKEIDQ
jgi:serine/threonine protein phosphatase PrpC